VAIEDRPDLAGPRRPTSYYRTATPDTFRALGIELRQGRVFDGRDRADAPPVAVVSESFAARMWPGQDPLGKRIGSSDGGDLRVTVVGVVEEARITSPIGANPLVTWRPQAQRSSPGIGNILIVKSELEPSTLAAAVRAAVAEIDPRVAVARVGTLDDVVAAEMAEPMRLRFFLTLFAVLGLVLGTVGVYGVVSYGVARRRAELGIRMALGASPPAVWGQVVRQGLAPVVLGIAGGVGLPLVLARLLASFLYEVAPSDPASLGAAALVLLAAGIVASLVPAWRAGRVDPAQVLRAE
jgi:putative ABC transport system permease protein